MQQSIRRASAVAALLFGLAACGGNGNDVSTKAGAPGLEVATTSLGRVLVDSRGLTVYMLTSDSLDTSTCPSSCLSQWVPVAELPSGTKPVGVTGPVSSTTTTAGKPIATVGGRPLYTYVKDKSPGEVTGQGVKSFGGVWYAMSPSGSPVTSVPKSSNDSGSGGY